MQIKIYSMHIETEFLIFIQVNKLSNNKSINLTKYMPHYIQTDSKFINNHFN
jgi:hypothetical protein